MYVHTYVISCHLSCTRRKSKWPSLRKEAVGRTGTCRAGNRHESILTHDDAKELLFIHSRQSVVPAIPSPYCLRPRNSAKEEPKTNARPRTFSVWASKRRRRERHYNLARGVDEPQVCKCKPPLSHDVQQCGRWVTLQRPLQVAKGSKSTGWAGPVGLVSSATVRSRWSAVSLVFRVLGG